MNQDSEGEGTSGRGAKRLDGRSEWMAEYLSSTNDGVNSGGNAMTEYRKTPVVSCPASSYTQHTKTRSSRAKLDRECTRRRLQWGIVLCVFLVLAGCATPFKPLPGRTVNWSEYSRCLFREPTVTASSLPENFLPDFTRKLTMFTHGLRGGRFPAPGKTLIMETVLVAYTPPLLVVRLIFPVAQTTVTAEVTLRDYESNDVIARKTISGSWQHSGGLLGFPEDYFVGKSEILSFLATDLAEKIEKSLRKTLPALSKRGEE